MRIELIIGFYLLLVSVSLAEHESLIAGPYKISFDLNATHNANITETHLETFSGTKYDTYTIILNNTNNFAFITAVHFSENISEDDHNVEGFLRGFDCHDITPPYERKIDNQTGILCVGVTPDGDIMYATQYWPKLDMSCIKGETNVQIDSNYPWDDGTLAILNTIHVELCSCRH